MSLARRLARLEAPARERWEKRWQAFHERRLELLPPAAYALLDAPNAPSLSPEEGDRLEAYLRELWAGLRLDFDVWEAWHAESEKGMPVPDEEPPRYHLTPERQPVPPGDPAEALATASTWSYEPTLAGYCHLGSVITLATAAAVAELNRRSPTPFSPARAREVR